MANHRTHGMWAVMIILVSIGLTVSVSDKIEGCDTYENTNIYAKEDPNNWVFTTNPISYNLTEMCIQNCFTYNYKHAGVTDNNQCLCSNKTGPWKTCSGERSEVKVYKTEPKDQDFVGCFIDKGMTWKPPGNYVNHSVHSCRDICRKSQFLYASLRLGEECQCISMLHTHAKSSSCNMTCRLTSDEICGGAEHISVYNTGYTIGDGVDVRYIGCYEQPLDARYYTSEETKEGCLTSCEDSYKAVIYFRNKTCVCFFNPPWSESPEPLTEKQCNDTTRKFSYKLYFAIPAVAISTIQTQEPLTVSSVSSASTTATRSDALAAAGNSQDQQGQSINVTETSTNTFTMRTTTTIATSTSSAKATTTTTTTMATTTMTASTAQLDTSNATTDAGPTTTEPQLTTAIESTSNISDATTATTSLSDTTASTSDSTKSSPNSSSVKTTSATNSTPETKTTLSSSSKQTSITTLNPSSVRSSPTTAEGNNTTTFSTNESNKVNPRGVIIDDTRIIIGTIISGLLLIVIIIFIAYAVKRSRRYAAERSGGQDSGCGSSCFSRGKASMVDTKYSKTILKSNLNDYVTHNMQRRNYFKDEYKMIPTGFYNKAEVGRRPENLNSKNRFKNILPYDDTRVVLTDGNDKTNYINASYIQNFHGRRVFIAAQGPKDRTVIDFWRMIWQENVPVIVMLTELAEASNECANYWPMPDDGCVEYGQVKVSLRHETKYPFYCVRNFHVRKDSIHRTVLQFQYTDWPDHGVPEAPSTLVNFYEDVQRSFDANIGPCVVHCSAGVGRTGTFLALDYLLDQARTENKIDVISCVYCLRKQRVNIVQTSSQYIFLHLALNHMLTLEITNVAVDRFMVYFQSIRQITTDGDSKLEEQYKMLEATKLHFGKEEMSDGLSEMNKGKNRTEVVVPRNQHRPGLETRYNGGTGYINAVVVDCCTKEHAFLVTQLPLQSTRGDLWCMVHDFGSSVILALDCREEDFYWPAEEDEVIAYGPFTVRCTNVDEVTSFITKYHLEVRKNKQALDVTLFLLDWSTDDVGPVSDLLRLHSIVQSMEKAVDDLYPIVVQCKTGFERSGLYCVLSNAIKMLKSEKRVDIYQCVQTTRTRRPQFIKSLNQYRFIHDAIKVYISKG